MTQYFELPHYKDDFSTFLWQLRAYCFSTQQKASDYCKVDRSQISRYENDIIKPDSLGYMAALAQLVAERNENEVGIQQHLFQAVNQAIRDRYRSEPTLKSWEHLCQVAEDYLIKQRTKPTATQINTAVPIEANSTWQTTLTILPDLPPDVPLIGIETYLTELLAVLTTTTAPWLVAIQGLGGLGKTALANMLIRQSELSKQFKNLAWVSAKQQTYGPGLGLNVKDSPALTTELLTDALLTQLDANMSLAQPFKQKELTLYKLLKADSYLIVVDNLETVADYEAIIPYLQRVANPSKILLTSRHSLRGYDQVYCFDLPSLNEAYTFDLIKQEATQRRFKVLLKAPKSQWQTIYEVVGGNPLALKLVIGQLSALPLEQVLTNLKEAKGKAVGDLYTYIYWQAWQLLTEAAKQVLVMMPLVEEGTLSHLQALTSLPLEDIEIAVQQLVNLSLVQFTGADLSKRRYGLHRLTETFLLTEAIKWQTSP